MNKQQELESGVILVSELSHFVLTDSHGRQARVTDLTVDAFAGDHPPVNFLLFQDEAKQLMALRWDVVKQADYPRMRFEVEDLRASEEASPELLRGQTLLRRDVMDALVLDLENRRVTRANDLWLKEADDQTGKLTLFAADASLQAVLRRLSRGWIRHRPQHSLCDWKYVEFLLGDPDFVTANAGKQRRITRMPPGEIATMLEAMPYLHAAELLKLLPDAMAADVLEMMTNERELQVFEELDDDQGTRLLALMAPDAAADLVGSLHPGKALKYLERLPVKQGGRIIELLRYPEDSVGGVMTNDVVFALASFTVNQAREALHERLQEPHFVYYVYVVDDENDRKLQGVITLRHLLAADSERLLEEVMNPYITTLNPLDSARGAADLVLRSHLTALPVVGQDGRLMGAMTVDAAVAQAAPQSWSAQVPKVFS